VRETLTLPFLGNGAGLLKELPDLKIESIDECAPLRASSLRCVS
jgi:hypothetical protein